MLEKWLTACRSCRRFDEARPLSRETLLELIGLARLAGSAANLQPLRFVPVCTEKGRAQVFETLGWAGYLKDWPGPAPGERPGGYLIMLTDRGLSKNAQIDAGIAAQSILLGAVERGLGGCMLGNIHRDALMEILERAGGQAISAERYEITLVLALGTPVERVVLEPLPPDGDVRYWRDAQGTHHVPKRSLEELTLEAGL